MSDSITELLANTAITAVQEGSITRALLSIINQRIAGLYAETEQNLALAVPSTASGVYLDRFCALFNLQRTTNETDSELRNRLSLRLKALASSNETAIMAAIYELTDANGGPLVKDLLIRPYTHGPGSFTVYVITDTPTPSVEVIAKVQTVLDQWKAMGIRAIAVQPRPIYVDLRIAVVLGDTAQGGRRATAVSDVRRAVKTYIDNIKVGQTLVASELVATAKRANPAIQDLEFDHMTINDQAALLVNQSASWDEKFVARNLVVR